ncbi:MAG TPA: hypothetical protein VHV83_22010, partial [Armatimonadota bacterium]|nr:hypothetical protein [Armatimonadota bacterium]
MRLTLVVRSYQTPIPPECPRLYSCTMAVPTDTRHASSFFIQHMDTLRVAGACVSPGGGGFVDDEGIDAVGVRDAQDVMVGAGFGELLDRQYVFRP